MKARRPHRAFFVSTISRPLPRPLLPLQLSSLVASSLIRILSDLHYGDRSSALTSLTQLTPLLDGVSQLILNGDTLDTRPSSTPERTAALLTDIRNFFAHSAPPTTILTGNHDPDISEIHLHALLAGALFITHGDALFDDLVPWSRDAALARQLVVRELSALPPSERSQLHPLLSAYRRAAYAIPQRHHSDPHGLRYLLGFLQDTIWPPGRVFRVLRAWREAPHRAAAFVQHHRLPARFFAMGHTHRCGITHTPSGLIVLNTGSFCPPCATGAIDITPDRLLFRRVERRQDAFHPGPVTAEFSLAPR
jgi:hypothetical protein